ncbi:MAG: acyltransferase [Pseudomonadota bacterium]
MPISSKIILWFDRRFPHFGLRQILDHALIRKLRAQGAHIGQHCRIYSPLTSTEPYLITMGDWVGIAGGVKLLTHDAVARKLRAHRPLAQSFGRITIGDDCFIGENAVLLPGTTLGSHCIVAAGAIVRGTFPANSLVAGNPAKVIGRASLLLKLFDKRASTLDTFGLPEKARRAKILAHFRNEDAMHSKLTVIKHKI